MRPWAYPQTAISTVKATIIQSTTVMAEGKLRADAGPSVAIYPFA
jgi:hypothetical protein